MTTRFSRNVNDSFEIYISLPETFEHNKTYNVVYYCDANLKSGKHLRELISSPLVSKDVKDFIFVGIGHIGNYHVLRRRDFILPTIQGSDTAGDSKNYGQVEHFYSFLKSELIPEINSRFKTNSHNNSILGHSLGGLFAFYCLFKSEDLFKKYFALSPALWIDKYSIYRFNKIKGGFNEPKYLYFASGAMETMNRILRGTNYANNFLEKASYTGLTYEYDIWGATTHNSEVPLSLQKILKEKLK